MNDEVARVERGRELFQRIFLARAFRSFEQDDRATAVRDLRQLQFAQMIAHRRERRDEIPGAPRRGKIGFPVAH